MPQPPPERPLRVAITGASGLIGSMLRRALTARGDAVTPVVRRAAAPGEISWDPKSAGMDPAALNGIDAVIHLAGESIAEGRWTEARKRELLESRRSGTRLLAEAMARAPGGPRVLVSASAIGFYGNRGEEILTEASPPGAGFLSEVVVAWEAGTGAAEDAGIRVVRIRIGLLLARNGGLLERVLLPFRLGLGGPLGSGKQWMSWIAADDLVRAFLHSLDTQALFGSVNAVAPAPVRNLEFTRTLGRVLHRPAIIPVPAAALRLLFGQLADEALLAGARVTPARLTETGFQFEYPQLEPALVHLIREPSV